MENRPQRTQHVYILWTTTTGLFGVQEKVSIKESPLHLSYLPFELKPTDDPLKDSENLIQMLKFFVIEYDPQAEEIDTIYRGTNWLQQRAAGMSGDSWESDW